MADGEYDNAVVYLIKTKSMRKRTTIVRYNGFIHKIDIYKAAGNLKFFPAAVLFAVLFV